jgi:hypothetical protein
MIEMMRCSASAHDVELVRELAQAVHQLAEALLPLRELAAPGEVGAEEGGD